jgi:hypothetical protein
MSHTIKCPEFKFDTQSLQGDTAAPLRQSTSRSKSIAASIAVNIHANTVIMSLSSILFPLG